MIQVDIPFAAAMGAAAAGAARRQLQAVGREEHQRTWLATNLVLMFGFYWSPIFFLVNYFGWETTHLWWTAASVTAYPWFIPIAMLLLVAAGNAGYLAGARFVRQGRLGANRALYLGIIIACIAWLVGLYPRTLKLGSHDTWQTAAWVYEDQAFMRAWAVQMIVWFGSYGAFIVHLTRRGRRVAPQGQIETVV